jgi:hypothetical protein
MTFRRNPPGGPQEEGQGNGDKGIQRREHTGQKTSRA